MLSSSWLLIRIINDNWMRLFVISGLIKVEADTLAETLIIPDITKPEFNYCFIIHCLMEHIQKLLCVMQANFICACNNTRTNAPNVRITWNHSSARALYPKVRSAHCARYNLQIFNNYYITVSGIPSGNKFILTCEDIDDFTDVKFVS